MTGTLKVVGKKKLISEIKIDEKVKDTKKTSKGVRGTIKSIDRLTLFGFVTTSDPFRRVMSSIVGAFGQCLHCALLTPDSSYRTPILTGGSKDSLSESTF